MSIDKIWLGLWGMKKDQDDNYLVYWARLSSYDDVYHQGYVGITSHSLDERKKSHFKNAKRKKGDNKHFPNALNKYGDNILWQILAKDLSLLKALEKEKHYRPAINIGWNTDIGGSLGVSPDWYKNQANLKDFKQKTSIATKMYIAKKDTTEARSKRAKEVWQREGYRESREGLFSGSNNSQFGKYGKNHGAYGHKKTEDGLQAISKANKGKIVSEKTREKMSKSRKALFAANRERREVERQNEIKKKQVQREVDIKNGKFKGENARASKFSDLEREVICKRRSDGETFSSIAKTYGVGISTIRYICQNWGPRNGYPFQATY